MAVLRTIMNRSFERSYDRKDRRRAMKVLIAAERLAGAKAPASVWREAERYAERVLGSRRFAPWLVVYATVAGEFREGWFPDNFYGRVVIPNVNRALRYIADMKSFTRIVFPVDAIPDVGYLINGTFYDRDHRSVRPSDVVDVIFDGRDEVVAKDDSSRQGMSVVKVRRDEFSPVEVAERSGNVVFQALITQHAFFDRFSPGSSTTMRVTTVRNPKGGHEARAAYLRFAGKDEQFVTAANSVRVALDPRSGLTSDVGYSSDWVRIDRHPQSSARFSPHPVPGFAKALELCRSLHERVPHVGAIGWDVMLDVDEKAWVVEWNLKHNDIKFSEATSGPCFTGLGWEKLRPVKGTWLI